MNTDTQPKTMGVGRLGKGGEFDVLGGVLREEVGLCDLLESGPDGKDFNFPLLTTTLISLDGKSYSGADFSLS